jgi:hypothetical protein
VFPFSRKSEPFTTSNVAGATRAFSSCTPVLVSLNKIGDAVEQSRLWVYNSSDDSINISLSSSLAGFMKKYPFFGDVAICYKLYGKAYIRRKNYIGAGYDYVHILNPFIEENEFDDYVGIDGKKRVKNYRITNENGTQSIVSAKDILKIGEGYSYEVSPEIAGLEYFINAYIFAAETMKESYADGGARKLVSLDVGDVDALASGVLDTERNVLQKKLGTTYGQRTGQSKLIVTAAKGTSIDLTTPIAQLDGNTNLKLFFSEIAIAFGVPPALVGINTSAYKKITEARQEFYQQTVSSVAQKIFHPFLTWINKSSEDTYIKVDFSELDFYQEALSKRASVIQQSAQGLSNLVNSNILTVEEARNEYFKLM